MRVIRDLRSVLRIRRRRGYYRTPVRPDRFRPLKLPRYFTTGGVITGPRGSRRLALNLINQEVRAGEYITPWRLNAALDRLIARVF
ncbi:MAG: hypothetical protein ACYTGB_11730 [Planctomycetota bacterium]|jgi:hypothetical protein